LRSYAPPQTLLGSTTPRLWTRPLVTGPSGPCGCGCALTPAASKGFSAIDFVENVLGFVLLPWQRWLFIHAMELRAPNSFRFRTVLVLIARQNGKTSWVEFKNLWKMFVLQVPLVIGTAQNLDLSEECWAHAVEIAEGIPELKAEIAHVDKTNGKKSLRLVSGSRWKIAAASRRGGRGLSGDDVNLDELREHQTWDAWGAVTKTTLARPNAQIFGTTNAGDDLSIVLNDLQGNARATVSNPDDADPSLGLFEWSAPDDTKCTCERPPGKPHGTDCQLRDRRLWAAANPSLGYTITEDAIASSLGTDPTNVFLTECLCVHVRDLGDPPPISEELWLSLGDLGSETAGQVAIAVDVTPDQSSSAVCIYGLRADGLGHVEVVTVRPGISWVVSALVKLKALHNPVAIAVDDKSAARALLPELARQGITQPADWKRPRRGDLAIPLAADMAAAWGGFLSACKNDELRHRDQPPLTAAVSNVKVRKIGEAEGIDRRGSTGDVSPLTAAALARWAFATRVDRIIGDLVYDDFDPATHVVDRFDIPAAWPRYLSAAFGFTTPFVAQWWAESPAGELFLYREIYQTGRLVEEHAATMLRAMAGEPIPSGFIADADAEDREALQRHLGMGNLPAKKSVSDGIQAVSSRLKASRLFVLRDSLVERDPALAKADLPADLVAELGRYVWAPGKEAPVAENDHGCTAMRQVVAFKDLRKRAGTRGWL
jgi:hypothetical protein